jgi:hypothetical protein
MDTAKPQAEHNWLEKLAGEWTSEGEGVMEPGKPPIQFRGTESVRSIGGLWIMAEGKGEMPDGAPSTTIMTLGYDPEKKRFVGTFFGSMMTYLWIYNGTLDASRKVLTLDTEGPGMAGAISRYQDIMEVVTDDHRILRSNMLGDDGKWNAFMTVHYHRRK